MHFMVFTKSLTTEVMCRFVGRLASHFAIRPTSGSTDTAHPDGVELRFLSRYSPELLPDKLVNADLKHRLPDHHRSPGPVRTRCRNPPVVLRVQELHAAVQIPRALYEGVEQGSLEAVGVVRRVTDGVCANVGPYFCSGLCLCE